MPRAGNAKGIFGTHDLPGKADAWINAIKDNTPASLQKGQQLGFNFVSGQRPQPNKDGRIATTLILADDPFPPLDHALPTCENHICRLRPLTR